MKSDRAPWFNLQEPVWKFLWNLTEWNQTVLLGLIFRSLSEYSKEIYWNHLDSAPWFKSIGACLNILRKLYWKHSNSAPWFKSIGACLNILIKLYWITSDSAPWFKLQEPVWIFLWNFNEWNQTVLLGLIFRSLSEYSYETLLKNLRQYSFV